MSVGGKNPVSQVKDYLSDKEQRYYFTGFQVAGTVGRQILDGVKKVKIFDKEIEVRADIEQILCYSSHMDSNHLVEFVEKSNNNNKLKKSFCCYGEIVPRSVSCSKN